MSLQEWRWLIEEAQSTLLGWFEYSHNRPAGPNRGILYPDFPRFYYMWKRSEKGWKPRERASSSAACSWRPLPRGNGITCSSGSYGADTPRFASICRAGSKKWSRAVVHRTSITRSSTRASS